MFRRRGARVEGQPGFGDCRRTKQQAAGWESRYRVVDETREHLHFAGDDYEPCVLADLSMEGAGLQLGGGEVAVGDRIELVLPLGAGRAATIQLRGHVRHASATGDGVLRVGLEFVEVGDLERALLLRLLREMSRATAMSA